MSNNNSSSTPRYYMGATPEGVETGGTALYRIGPDGEPQVAAMVPARRRGPVQLQGSSNPGRRFTQMDSTAQSVPPVTRRIEAIKAELAAKRGFDPRTGEHLDAVTGPKREHLANELGMLEQWTLPYQVERGLEADAWLAANPEEGSDEDIMEQVAEREATQSLAKQMIREREATKLADAMSRPGSMLAE